jgi:hypothetical protein
VSRKTWKNVPTMMSVLGPYLSNKMPTKGPRKNRKRDLKQWDPGNGAAVVAFEGPIFVILLNEAHAWQRSLVVRVVYS